MLEERPFLVVSVVESLLGYQPCSKCSLIEGGKEGISPHAQTSKCGATAMMSTLVLPSYTFVPAHA